MLLVISVPHRSANLLRRRDVLNHSCKHNMTSIYLLWPWSSFGYPDEGYSRNASCAL